MKFIAKKAVALVLLLTFVLPFAATQAGAETSPVSIGGNNCRKATFIFDPGHGGTDLGNGLSRSEAYDNIRLAGAVGDILSKSGIPVAFTRNCDMYLSDAQRVALVKKGEFTYCISIHRAAGISAGITTYVSAQTGAQYTLAKNLQNAMASSGAGFADKGVAVDASLEGLYGENTAALRIEVGSIDVAADNTRFDSGYSSIANAIASVCASTSGRALYSSANAGIEALMFNANVYYGRYKDIRDVLGNDTPALKYNWEQYGIKDGRCASLVLDIRYYLDNNEDLKAVFGTDYAAAYNHFITTGYKEYRKSSQIYDGAYYRDHNGDLASFSGEELIYHFVNYGMKEGRAATADYDVNYYRQKYGDIVNAYGSDLAQSTLHYMSWGIWDNREGNDNKPPVISGVEAKALTASSFEISFTATDNNAVSKAIISVWTGNTDASDMKEYSGIINGSSVTCNVKTSDFGNKTDYYNVCITAFDAKNNASDKVLLVLYGGGTQVLTLWQSPSAMAEKFAPKNSAELLLDASDKSIHGLAAGKSVQQIKDTFLGGGISVFPRVSESGFVGNGSLVRHGSETYTAVVIGDVNGTGVIDANDYLQIKSHFAHGLAFDEPDMKAADTNSNGEITATDYLQIKRHLTGHYDLYNTEKYNILKNGNCSFIIAYNSSADSALASSAARLQAAIYSYTGMKLDVEKALSAECAINLKISASAPDGAALASLDYAVSKNGSTVNIVAANEYGITLAVENFISEYVERDTICVPSNINTTYKYKELDNSSLMPDYVTDEYVTLETTGELSTPDWFKSAVMVEMRIETATKAGTFEAAIPLLDHYAQMGVNAIWLTPIYEKGPGGNGYGNVGLHSVEPAMTGKRNYAEGWQVVKNFVNEAHKRNIRIIFDVITWGTMKGAPLVSEHPEYFSGEAWGNAAFNWNSAALKEWFISNAVANIITTGADGYRCDCEPQYAGYAVFAEVRRRLLAAGRKVVILAEDGNNRQNAFDSEMDSVLYYSMRTRAGQYTSPVNYYLDALNIVDSVKSGTGVGSDAQQKSGTSGTHRFYTYGVTNHDYQFRLVSGNRLSLGYQAIFSPYIPYWYMGDEFFVTQDKQAVLFDVAVDYSLVNQPKNKLFFEDIKQMIRIRLSYPEIFTYFPDDHRNSNICKVNTSRSTLQAYARYCGNKGVMIIPNNDSSSDGYFTASVPFESMGLNGYTRFRLTDLMTGKVIAEGDKTETASFDGSILYQRMGVYLIEGIE